MTEVDIKKLVIRGSEILEEGKFKYDRKAYLNASEAMTCIRKQWYSKHTPELQEPQQWGYARRGIHGEKYLVESLLASNVPLIHAYPEQWSMQDEKRKISCTPDGFIMYDDEMLGIEFKTIDPRTNLSNLPKPAHVAQLQICMEMIDQNVDHSMPFEKGLLVYMDASNFDKIIQFTIDRDYGILDRMKKRSNKVLNSDDPSSLEREGKAAGGKECKTMCGFADVCGVKVTGRGKPKANRGSNVDGDAKRYVEIKDEIDVLRGEQDNLKEDIKVELQSRDTLSVMVGDIQVELFTVKGRASLDKKAVKAAGIDLSPFEKVGASSERLTVKRI